jgi:5-methylcytosine-specific restriction endonuclease McrA
LENSEAIIAKVHEYRKENKEAISTRRKASYALHKTQIRQEARDKYKEDPTRVKASCKTWRDANRDWFNAYGAKRHAGKMKRTPAWLTKEDKLKMKFIYTEAQRLTKETGVLHDVDHIIPLQGKTVSGLHVPENLQILTASENRKKHNSY